MPKATILIVDDEKNIVEAVKYRLEQEGFSTLIAHDGRTALRVASKETPNAILLDWMLPEVDGLEVCRLLKRDAATRDIPVIMLTVRSDEADKVLGIEMGADDFVTKPFSQRELVARLKTVLRRAAAPTPPTAVWRIGDVRVDWDRHLALIRHKTVELTSKELRLLKALVDANGRVLSQKILLETVWNHDPGVDLQTHTVAFHISQLRKKLPPIAPRIVTIKNAGYRLVLDEHADYHR